MLSALDVSICVGLVSGRCHEYNGGGMEMLLLEWNTFYIFVYIAFFPYRHLACWKKSVSISDFSAFKFSPGDVLMMKLIWHYLRGYPNQINIKFLLLTHWAISHSSQCSTTGVTKAMVCVIMSRMHIKPLLLIGKSSLCGGSRFFLLLSEWFYTNSLTPYNRK